MTHEVLEWSRFPPEQIISRAGETLRQGQAVVVPTDTVYALAVHALLPEAADLLKRYAEPGGAVAMALADARETADWLPHLSSAGRRLTRGAWPGPLIFQGSGRHGLAERLPGPVRQLVEVDGLISLWAPGHPILASLMRTLGAPLILMELPEATTSEQAQTKLTGSGVPLIADGPTYFSQAPTIVAAAGKNLALRREGIVTAGMVQELSRCRILFVCTGNTCRSPLAMALCSNLLAQKLGCTSAELPERGFQVLSAGLAAARGCEASPEAVLSARELGSTLEEHRSQPLTAELLARADFLFTMTNSHLRLLESLDPALGPRPRLLSPDGADIADPIGREPEVYRACARQILASLEDWLPVFLESA